MKAEEVIHEQERDHRDGWGRVVGEQQRKGINKK